MELNGALVQLAADRLLPVTDLQATGGKSPFWVITDFQESVTQIMTVDTPPKYADVMVKKRLQESGEFDGPVTVIPLWKQKAGRNATTMLFTAMPAAVYTHYMENVVSNQACNVLFFPVYRLLMAMLSKVKDESPAAVVFQHDRFADVIVGSRGKIYYADRFVAFDAEADQINGLWQTVINDLSTIEANHRIHIESIIPLAWVDGMLLPPGLAPEGKTVISLETREVFAGEDRHETAFFNAVDGLHAWDSVSPLFEIMAWYARQTAPVASCAMVAAAVILLVAGFLLADRSDALQQHAMQLADQIDNAVIDQPAGVRAETFTETLAFIQDLDYCHTVPSYRAIVNALSDVSFPGLEFESLNLDYARTGLKITLAGRIAVPFDAAHSSYKQFLLDLEKKGFRITDSRFNTTIDISDFLLTLEKAFP